MQKDLVQSEHPVLRKCQNVIRYCPFVSWAEYANIPGHFGLFLSIGCSDSICSVSGSLRHKFRVPTWSSLEHLEKNWPSPPWGPFNLFLKKSKMSQWSLFYAPAEKSLAIKFQIFWEILHTEITHKYVTTFLWKMEGLETI